MQEIKHYYVEHDAKMFQCHDISLTRINNLKKYICLHSMQYFCFFQSFLPIRAFLRSIYKSPPVKSSETSYFFNLKPGVPQNSSGTVKLQQSCRIFLMLNSDHYQQLRQLDNPVYIFFMLELLSIICFDELETTQGYTALK